MLSDRMMTNVSFFEHGDRVADIGCDHGFVSIYMLRNEIAKSVIAMDVGEGPLGQAKENIRKAGLTDRISIRLSDGLKALQFDDEGRLEADACLIAGMGGRLVIKIIEDSLEKARALKYLVIQPQSDLQFVREWLANNSFAILDEKMTLEDGKYYTAMKIANGSMNELSEEKLIYGPVLLEKKDELLMQYLNKELEKFTEVISQMDEDSEHRGYARVSDKLCVIKKALEYYE